MPITASIALELPGCSRGLGATGEQPEDQDCQAWHFRVPATVEDDLIAPLLSDEVAAWRCTSATILLGLPAKGNQLWGRVPEYPSPADTTRPPELARMVEASVAVRVGVASPAVLFVLPVLGLIAVDTAASIATWTGLGLIGFYGFWAARFAGAPRGRALVKGAVVVLIRAA